MRDVLGALVTAEYDAVAGAFSHLISILYEENTGGKSRRDNKSP